MYYEAQEELYIQEQEYIQAERDSVGGIMKGAFNFIKEMEA